MGFSCSQSWPPLLLCSSGLVQYGRTSSLAVRRPVAALRHNSHSSTRRRSRTWHHPRRRPVHRCGVSFSFSSTRRLLISLSEYSAPPACLTPSSSAPRSRQCVASTLHNTRTTTTPTRTTPLLAPTLHLPALFLAYPLPEHSPGRTARAFTSPNPSPSAPSPSLLEIPPPPNARQKTDPLRPHQRERRQIGRAHV